MLRAWYGQRIRAVWREHCASRSAFAERLVDLFDRWGISTWRDIPVIDIGCGEGHLASRLGRLGAKVTALESKLSQTAATLAADREAPFRLLHGDAHSLPFDLGSFQVAILADVLEHVADPARVVEETARVLRPGGLAFISTTNRLSVVNLLLDPHFLVPFISVMPRGLAAWYVTKLWRVNQEFDVGTYFTPHQLRRLLKNSGFQCDELPIYREKIQQNDLQIAPGRGVLRSMLRAPWMRHLAARVAESWTFSTLVQPGLYFMARRLPDRVPLVA